ncbi:DUF418 domain-containing protein [Spongiactinospora sp. TRM90649]|uniref:DUF418 domain-containing protein n=1 Tax=Spongiactinospora sp. TRM90649 TaxID=3031114 RepID=UPI0023F6A6B2|nr:DUF418 domain-containing protein [Spongiactinospora sp. TRM90649]MDF5752479.1 DUF418 domain-containing protein [Spongiactinospora sp. TRM90649]
MTFQVHSSRTSDHAAPRIAALDVVRGFALCGVLVANVRPISALGGPPVVHAPPPDARIPWPHLLVDQRFFVIFSLLFGVGFSLLLESAGRRGARARPLLLRRLAVLLVIGLAHHFLLWEGDILVFYAVVGVVVLLPSTWLPRWAVAALAVVLMAAALLTSAGHLALLPGLFLLGSALTRYGVIARLEATGRGTAVLAVLAVVFAAGAVPVTIWQLRMESAPGFAGVMGTAGLLTAGAYVCGLLLLLRTPLRAVLRAVFAPLGRMALTNYVSASALVLAIGLAIGRTPDAWTDGTVLAIAAAVLVLQWAWSALWLRAYRFGPLEWLWRWATWGSRPPLRAS